MRKSVRNTIRRSVVACLAAVGIICGVNTIYGQDEMTIHTTVCDIETHTDGYSKQYDIICEIPHEIGSGDWDYVSYPTSDPGYSVGQEVDLVVWYGVDGYEIIDIK